MKSLIVVRLILVLISNNLLICISGKVSVFDQARCMLKCYEHITGDALILDKPLVTSHLRADNESSPSAGDNLDQPLPRREDHQQLPCHGKEASAACRQDCLQSCKRRIKLCSKNCKKNAYGCQLGCRYLRSVVKIRPGRCPSFLSKILTNYDECKPQCNFDWQCDNPMEKCCNSPCSKQCVQPHLVDHIPPLAPKLRPKVSGNQSEHVVVLDWGEPYQLNRQKMILFILQIRVCSLTEDIYMPNPWMTLLVEPTYGARVDDFDHTKCYEFRLAAITEDGSKGFGPASQPYTTNPMTPKPPRNVTDGKWRVYATGKISVTIAWSDPVHNDVIITGFKIDWVRDFGLVRSNGHSLEALTRYVQTVPASHHRYVIENLEPDRAYKIQVRTVGRWNGITNLLSQSNTIFISTVGFNPIQSASKESRITSSGANNNHNRVGKETERSCGCSQTSSQFSFQNVHFQILQPEYYKNQLSALIISNFTRMLPRQNFKVTWSRRVCIDSNGSIKESTNPPSRKGTFELSKPFRLTNLNFNCRYMVRMTPNKLSVSNTQPHFQLCFCTPLCNDVRVTSGSPTPVCPKDRTSMPSPPRNISVHLISKTTYRLSWEPPMMSHFSSAGEDFSRYRVVWGPREDEPVNTEMYNDEVGFIPIMNYQQSDVRVFPKTVKSFLLNDLKPAILYIVKIQTLKFDEATGSERASSPAPHYFTTAGFQDSTVNVKVDTPAEVARYIYRSLSNNSELQNTFHKYNFLFAMILTLLTFIF